MAGIKGMFAKKKAASVSYEEVSAHACLEDIHRVVASKAPHAYAYLCEKLPKEPKEDDVCNS